MINNLIKKYVLNDEIPMQGRLFNVITVIGALGALVASVVNAFNSITSLGAVFIFLLFVIMAALIVYANKTGKYDNSSVVICLGICCVLFPIISFTSGGITSGMPSWYILGLFVIFVMLQGNRFFVCLGLAVITQIVCMLVQYLFPEVVATYESGSAAQFQDIVYSYLVVSVAIGSAFKLQMNVYVQEKKKAENASRAKANFLANMSHEIRTPINAIVGLNELILRESNEETIKHYADLIESASGSLLNIINDVLDFSKIESGKIDIEEQEYSLQELITKVDTLIRPRAEGGKLDFNIIVEKGVPSVLYGDEGRVSQIVLNLLTNAVKYTQEGSVTLRVGGKRQEKQNEKKQFNLLFEVIDTGSGIREEDQKKMFESFQRIDEKKHRSIEGTGLGLAITKLLVEIMHGTIRVESQYGKGSCFYVELPQTIIMENEVKYVPLAMGKGKKDSRRKGPHFVAPEARVLIVDDNEINRRVLVKLLGQTKMQVESVDGGVSCIEKMEKEKYDIILMDHMMPELDGVETLHTLKQRDILGDTVVIVLTANAISGVRDYYLKEGFQDYLSKPVDWHMLEKTIMHWLPNDKIIPL